MKSQNQLSELIFVILIFVIATRTNKQHCAAVYIRTYDCARPLGSLSDQGEELTNCCSNSIDAGYSNLLRCEGEIRFIRTTPFLLASGDKLYFFSEDARSSRREHRALAGPWSRGRHQRAQLSQTRSATPDYTISWPTLA